MAERVKNFRTAKLMKKMLYLSYTRLDYSLNAVYINGLRQNGVEVLCFKLPSKGIGGHLKALRFVRDNKKDSDALLVGYDSSNLAVFLRLFYWKRIIYCAVLPVYERLVFSRGLASPWSFKGIYYWLIDILAFRFSNLIMIESNQQIEYVSKSYFVSKKKLFRAWIGVDEVNFYYDSSIIKFPVFTVLFRGALMPEAGAEYVIEAAKVLEGENIRFIMQSGGMLLSKIEKIRRELNPKNLEFKSDFLPYEELRILMQKCHLSLGQLSVHPRLNRTIPHKVYESLIMKLPYLTASNKGILELVKDGETCLTCEPANSRSLADKILWAKNNSQELEKIAKNGHEFYIQNLTPQIIARKLLDKIESPV